MKKRQKIEAIAVKQCKTKNKMSLFSKKEDKKNTRNDTDTNQVKDKYPLQV